MEYNKCKNCGASDGRAGNLVSSPSIGSENECMNCYDTRKTGAIVIHDFLSRTEDEIKRTMGILSQE